MTILETNALSKQFGGLTAVSNLDFKVEEGELLGLIGPNGAGKSTCFNLLSGAIRPTSGRIFLQDEDITGLKPHLIVARGLTRTFQETRLFMNLSVRENLKTAFHVSIKGKILGDIFGSRSQNEIKKRVEQKTEELISLAGLTDLTTEAAKNLPHGHQRILGVTMALATRPKLLCLDEPVTGMNQTEVEFMIKFIQRIRKMGITIILVEHAMKVVMGICDRVVVINFGEKIAEGTTEEIRKNQKVIEAYLGGGHNASRSE